MLKVPKAQTLWTGHVSQTRKRQQKSCYSLLPIDLRLSILNPYRWWPHPDSQTTVGWVLLPNMSRLRQGTRVGVRTLGDSSSTPSSVSSPSQGCDTQRWVFIFFLQSCGGPALSRAHVHGWEVPRRAGAVGSIIQISFKVNAHSWGGHVAFNDIPLVLWSTTRNRFKVQHRRRNCPSPDLQSTGL